uniref:Reverse transcriptase RNase H-like domain-containing protein n=1 Tax=Cajanus cajan TaxID=3821 RepID=A0A151UCF2_CAJCA|nr:hypothetical protein KK1_021269 [Cajanus cajan]
MPILIIPNFWHVFVLETNNFAITISQQGRPIAFYNKRLYPFIQMTLMYVCKLLVIMSSIKKWIQYLVEKQFHIISDKKFLKEILTQTFHTLEQ